MVARRCGSSLLVSVAVLVVVVFVDVAIVVVWVLFVAVVGCSGCCRCSLLSLVNGVCLCVCLFACCLVVGSLFVIGVAVVCCVLLMLFLVVVWLVRDVVDCKRLVAWLSLEILVNCC